MLHYSLHYMPHVYVYIYIYRERDIYIYMCTVLTRCFLHWNPSRKTGLGETNRVDLWARQSCCSMRILYDTMLTLRTLYYMITILDRILCVHVSRLGPISKADLGKSCSYIYIYIHNKILPRESRIASWKVLLLHIYIYIYIYIYTIRFCLGKVGLHLGKSCSYICIYIYIYTIQFEDPA